MRLWSNSVRALHVPIEVSVRLKSLHELPNSRRGSVVAISSQVRAEHPGGIKCDVRTTCVCVCVCVCVWMYHIHSRDGTVWSKNSCLETGMPSIRTWVSRPQDIASMDLANTYIRQKIEVGHKASDRISNARELEVVESVTNNTIWDRWASSREIYMCNIIPIPKAHTVAPSQNHLSGVSLHAACFKPVVSGYIDCGWLHAP